MAEHPVYAPDHAFRVLTREQWEFWRRTGYLVVPDVVPSELCDRAADALWRFLDADPDDPTTWYELPYNRPDAPTRRAIAGMLEIYHHQAMWDIRQHPKMYDVFVDLWGHGELWVTIDRANINVPATEEWVFEGFLHWDLEPQPGSTHAEIQGIVALVDTTADMGGLQVVPEAFQRYDELASVQVDAERPRWPDTTGMEVVHVECNAGDLVVWESRTVHGTGKNASDRPRIAQYMTMEPAQPTNRERLDQRLASFDGRTADAGNWSFRGDPRELEVGDAPQLTDLGRKLLGVDVW